MIEITNEAYTELFKKASAADRYNFRVAIRGGGCGGYEYHFDFCDTPDPSDIELDWGRLTFTVDRLSAQYLVGIIIDYVKDGLNEMFVFKNPNATYNCGCGKSVAF